MAKVTATIGAATSATATVIEWADTGSGRVTVPSGLQGPAGAAELRRLRIEARSFTNTQLVTINADFAAPGDTASDAGPDLSDAWKRFGAAIRIESGGNVVDLPGPSAAGLVLDDQTEPHQYFSTSRTLYDAANAFITAYPNLGEQDQAGTRVTLTDESLLPPVDAVAALSAALSGSVAGSADLIDAPRPPASGDMCVLNDDASTEAQNGIFRLSGGWGSESWDDVILGPFGTNSWTPSGLDFDSNGNAYVGSRRTIHRRSGGLDGGTWDSGGAAAPTVDPSNLRYTIIADVAVHGTVVNVLMYAGQSSRVHRRTGTFVGGGWDDGIPMPANASNPRSIAFDRNGVLHLMDANTSRIYRYENGSWDAGIPLPRNAPSANSMAFDNADDIYVANNGTHLIHRRTGGYASGSWDGTMPYLETDDQYVGLAFIPSGPPTGIAMLDAGLDGSVSAQASAVTSRLLVFDGSDSTLWEIDPDGADDEGTELRGISPREATTMIFSSLSSLGDRVFIINSASGPGSVSDYVFEIDPDGADNEGTELRQLSNGLGQPLAVTGKDARLFITDIDGGDDIWRVDPDAHYTEGTRLRGLPSGIRPLGSAFVGNRFLVTDEAFDDEGHHDYGLWEISLDGADTQGARLRGFPVARSQNPTIVNYGGRLLSVSISLGVFSLWEIDPDGASSQGKRLRGFPSGLVNPASMAVLFAEQDRGPTASLTGGLSGSIRGVASLSDAPPINAVASLAGGLAGAVAAVASLSTAAPLEASASLDAGLAGSVAGEGGVYNTRASASLDAGLEGSISGQASLQLVIDGLPEGVSFDCAAILERTDRGDVLYADSDRGGTNTPVSGDIGIGQGDTRLSRIRWRLGGWLEIADNDNPSALDLAAYFGSGGAGHDLIAFVVDPNGNVASQPVAELLDPDIPGSADVIELGRGTSYRPNAQLASAFSAINVGDRFIFALGRDSARGSTHLFGGLVGAIRGVADLSTERYRTGTASLGGDLTGFLNGIASLGPAPALDAASSPDAGLVGAVRGAASLGVAPALDAAASLSGDLAVSLAGDPSLGMPPTLDAIASLTAGLAGSVAAAPSLGSLPRSVTFSPGIRLPREWLADQDVNAQLRSITLNRDGGVSLELTGTAAFLTDLLPRFVLTVGALVINGIGTGTFRPSNHAQVAQFATTYSAQFPLPSVTVRLHLPASEIRAALEYQLVTPQATVPDLRSMAAIGVTSRVTLPAVVAGIRPGSDLTAELSLVPLANGIHDAETGPLPPYDPRITLPAGQLVGVRPPFSGRGPRGFPGQDGSGQEFVFRRTSTASPPSQPTTSGSERLTDDHVPVGWTDDPVGPTASLPFEWVSHRSRARGATVWSEFSPVGLWAVLSRDGEDGMDGKSIEFIFQRTRTNSRPATPAASLSNRMVDDYVPRGWTDDASGVDSFNRYEWVSKRVRPTGGTLWSTFSLPVIWGNYAEDGEDGEDGVDGASAEFVFRRTSTFTRPSRPTTTFSQRLTDDFVPTGWTDDPVGTTSAVRWEWVSKRTRPRGTGAWNEFGIPSLWSNFALDGRAAPRQWTRLASPRRIIGSQTQHAYRMFGNLNAYEWVAIIGYAVIGRTSQRGWATGIAPRGSLGTFPSGGNAPSGDYLALVSLTSSGGEAKIAVHSITSFSATFQATGNDVHGYVDSIWGVNTG